VIKARRKLSVKRLLADLVDADVHLESEVVLEERMEAKRPERRG
jgi:hypothetical protein